MAQRWAASLIGAWAVYQLGLGAYFAFLRPPLLPEDYRFLGAALGEGRSASLAASWLRLVFIVMAGQMAAVGVLVGLTATRMARRGADRMDVVAVTLGGALSVAVMSAVNFALLSDFRWWLVVPVVIWSAGLLALWRAVDAQHA
jgi:hypothetical protein